MADDDINLRVEIVDRSGSGGSSQPPTANQPGGGTAASQGTPGGGSGGIRQPTPESATGAGNGVGGIQRASTAELREMAGKGVGPSMAENLFKAFGFTRGIGDALGRHRKALNEEAFGNWRREYRKWEKENQPSTAPAAPSPETNAAVPPAPSASSLNPSSAPRMPGETDAQYRTRMGNAAAGHYEPGARDRHAWEPDWALENRRADWAARNGGTSQHVPPNPGGPAPVPTPPPNVPGGGGPTSVAPPGTAPPTPPPAPPGTTPGGILPGGAAGAGMAGLIGAAGGATIGAILAGVGKVIDLIQSAITRLVQEFRDSVGMTAPFSAPVLESLVDQQLQKLEDIRYRAEHAGDEIAAVNQEMTEFNSEMNRAWTIILEQLGPSLVEGMQNVTILLKGMNDLQRMQMQVVEQAYEYVPYLKEIDRKLRMLNDRQRDYERRRLEYDLLDPHGIDVEGAPADRPPVPMFPGGFPVAPPTV